MSKVKTNSAAKKRFKLVGKKTVKRAQAYRRHLLTKKGAKRRRHLRSGDYVSSVDVANILTLLGH